LNIDDHAVRGMQAEAVTVLSRCWHAHSHGTPSPVVHIVNSDFKGVVRNVIQSTKYLTLIGTKSVCGQRAIILSWTVVYTARLVLASLQIIHRHRRDVDAVVPREPDSTRTTVGNIMVW